MTPLFAQVYSMPLNDEAHNKLHSALLLNYSSLMKMSQRGWGNEQVETLLKQVLSGGKTYRRCNLNKV